MELFLQCDADGCDHKEFVEAITEDMVGKECPKCGESLLTKEDFEMFAPLMQTKKILQDLGLIADERTPEHVERVSVSVHCHENTVTIKGE